MSSPELNSVPQGHRKLAGGASHRIMDQTSICPGRGDGGASPQIAFIIFGATPTEEIEVFLLKRPCAAMFLLGGNVFTNRRALRSADGEGAITFLPLKGALADFIVDPPGRNTFQLAQDVGEAMGGAQTDEQMHMVGDTADGFGDAIQTMDDAAKEGVQAWAIRRSDERLAVLGGENEMIVEGEMGRGHETMLSRSPCRGRGRFSSIPGGWRHRLISGVPAGRQLAR